MKLTKSKNLQNAVGLFRMEFKNGEEEAFILEKGVYDENGELDFDLIGYTLKRHFLTKQKECSSIKFFDNCLNLKYMY